MVPDRACCMYNLDIKHAVQRLPFHVLSIETEET